MAALTLKRQDGDIQQLDKANVRLNKQMYHSKLVEIDKALQTSIQSQVVETQRALELLKSSFGDIAAIDSNFKQIEEKCKNCRDYLEDFKQIKKLSVARKNLKISTKIVRLFREVPNKADHLLKLLENNPDDYLYYIYKNLRKLVKLRDETLSKGLKYMTSLNENEESNEESMRKHFEKIDTVMFKLERQIRMNVTDMLYLAKEMPETLVETLRICESEDRSTHKILCFHTDDWKRWRDIELNEEIEEDEDEEYELAMKARRDRQLRRVKPESMADKVKYEMEQSIISMMERLDSEQSNGTSGSPLNGPATASGGRDGQIKAFLDSIDENMLDLDIINDSVRSAFPPSYDVVTYCVSRYFQFLQPRILDQLSAESVPTQERLRVVSWIAKFKLRVATLEKAMAKYGDELKSWKSMEENLSDQERTVLESYLRACDEKLSGWIRNIVDNEAQKKEFFEVDDIPRTHCPQDLFTALNHQFTTATEKLRGQPFVSVIVMIMESLDLFAKLLREYIDGNWRSFSEDKYFCALLNSCYDVSQKLKAKSDAILETPDVYNIDEAAITDLDDAFDDRICKFTNLGKHCSVLLADYAFADVIQTEIMSQIWIERNDPVIAGLVATLQEYFDDFKRWIQEPYFFWEAVKALIGRIADGYIEILLSPNSASILKQLDAERLAEHIRNDVNLLNEYFGDDDEFGDVAKVWNTHYKVLNAIHAVLDCEAGFLEGFAGPITSNAKWGSDLMKLVQKKRKIKDKIEKERIVMAEREQMSDDEDDFNHGSAKKPNILKNAFWKKGKD